MSGRRPRSRASERSRGLLPAAVLILLVLGVGCGDAGPERGRGEESADPFSGTDRWSLLTVPRDGGSAALYPLVGSGKGNWEGSAALPPSDVAERLGHRLLVLRSPDGEVVRYDPFRGRTDRLGSVQAAYWTGADGYGLWAPEGPGEGEMWLISAEGTWRYRPSPPVRWAAPTQEGEAVALVGEAEETRLVLYRRGEEAPVGERPVDLSPPGTVTGWGRQVVLTGSRDGGDAIRLVQLPDLSLAGSVEVDGSVSAVAASPSSHELYVAVEAPPRLLVVGRQSLEVRRTVSFERPLREVRPGLLGGAPLAWDGERAHLVPWTGSRPVPLPGRWRRDLPISLPGGEVLVADEGEVRRLRVDGREVVETERLGTADRWWIPLRWRPEGEIREESAPGSDRLGSEGAAGAGETGAGGVDTATSRSPADTAGVPEVSAPEAGFYVIVRWTRSREEARAAVEPLGRDGYPVAVDRREDAAGQTWFRALVGPYAARREADRVADRLAAERGFQVRVQELRPELPEGTVR